MLKNKIVVYAYVCGDILHSGHILFLKNAKNLGDILITGVLTNQAIMEKKSEPSLSFIERIEIVGSLECVDLAIPQNTYCPYENVLLIRPDILIESASHSSEIIEESRRHISSCGGSLMVFPYYNEQSSTNIKTKIIEKGLI